MTERLHFHFSLSCIGEGNGNPLQCSCLENPRDGGAWWAAVYGVTQSRSRLKWLSSLAAGGGHRGSCFGLCHRVFCLCFPPRVFIVSGLTFRSLIHFEFIFVYCVRKCSNFILLHVAVQFSQHHLLKRLSLPHCIFLPPLSKIRYP